MNDEIKNKIYLQVVSLLIGILIGFGGNIFFDTYQYLSGKTPIIVIPSIFLIFVLIILSIMYGLQVIVKYNVFYSELNKVGFPIKNLKRIEMFLPTELGVYIYILFMFSITGYLEMVYEASKSVDPVLISNILKLFVVIILVTILYVLSLAIKRKGFSLKNYKKMFLLDTSIMLVLYSVTLYFYIKEFLITMAIPLNILNPLSYLYIVLVLFPISYLPIKVLMIRDLNKK